MTAENDADREAFEAYRKSEYLYSDKANPDAILLATLWNGFMAGAAHARAQAGEPVAWVNESYRNEILQRSGKVYWHAPMMCGQEFKGSFPVYLAAPAQEPVAVPAGEPIRSAKGEGIPEVIYASSPVIKWPNGVLSGTWESKPDERCSARFAASPVAPPADRPQQFMSDKTRQFVEPVRKMLADGINVQALGEATNQVIDGAFRSLVGHIDELEMDLAALRTAVAMKAPPADSGEVDCPTCAGNGEVVTDWDRYLNAQPGDVGDESVADCPTCNGTGKASHTPATQPGGAVKVNALEWRDGPPYSGMQVADCAFGEYWAWGGCWSRGSLPGTLVKGGVDGAKAAAQIDYEQRAFSTICTLTQDPVAWQHRYIFRGASEMPWREGRDPGVSPFTPEDECYSDYKVEERALYDRPTLAASSPRPATAEKIELTPSEVERVAFNLSAEFVPEFVKPMQAFALASYREISGTLRSRDMPPHTALSPSPSGWNAGAEAMREKCAAAVGPTGERPCDCERCDCRNRDDAERVARWDEAKACADAIRALPLPTQPAGEG